jgi:hypothetical protein
VAVRLHDALCPGRGAIDPRLGNDVVFDAASCL